VFDCCATLKQKIHRRISEATVEPMEEVRDHRASPPSPPPEYCETSNETRTDPPTAAGCKEEDTGAVDTV